METSLKKTSTTITDRDQLEKLLKETKQLKQKVDVLEKENMLLKKSIYDLSVKYSVAHHQKLSPFAIEESAQDNVRSAVTGTSKEINLENSTGLRK